MVIKILKSLYVGLYVFLFLIVIEILAVVYRRLQVDTPWRQVVDVSYYVQIIVENGWLKNNAFSGLMVSVIYALTPVQDSHQRKL